MASSSEHSSVAAVPLWIKIVAYVSSVALPPLGLLLGMYLGYRRSLGHAFLVVLLSTIIAYAWYPLVLGPGPAA